VAFLKNQLRYSITIHFSLSDFIAQIYRNPGVEPCFLCNTIHLMSIHSHPDLKYRDPETGPNCRMSVVCVSYAVTFARGRQYTKRRFPDFLVCGCIIRLDATFVAIEAGTGTTALIEAACVLMGCVDDRTVKRHVALASATVRLVNLRKREIIAENPETAAKPDITPDMSTGETLRLLPAAIVLGWAGKDFEAGHRRNSASRMNPGDGKDRGNQRLMSPGAGVILVKIDEH